MNNEKLLEYLRTEHDDTVKEMSKRSNQINPRMEGYFAGIKTALDELILRIESGKFDH